ncbi:BON domain-containing protein [Pendulispora brunnea]|uniref:BON domain-containing protein n=1 Tax=Pendulispora brunnea TaxID=2905690 RepID=A0ABZ2KES7_9BACT
MRMAKLFLLGMGVGSGVTYFFDPRQGARRRAMARDKAVHFAGVVRAQVDAGARDLSHRMHGLVSAVYGAVHTFAARETVSDDVLQARVRSALGRVCSHPHAIHVTVDRGVVELTGLVLSEERASVIRHVARVPGVGIVKDLLDAHTRAEGIPALQGAPRPTKPAVIRRLSSPAGRLVLSSAGILALGAVAPSLLLPIGTILGIGVAAHKEEQTRARRARTLERRGSRRARGPGSPLREEMPPMDARERSTNGHVRPS